jgi:hypothetical protein
VNALGSGNPDPWALEQQGQQPWGIGGRTNHYQFDMNRDALAMSQLESRQIARAIRSWHPQVFVDHHGQTASYFFPPTAPPLHHVYPERDLVRWTSASAARTRARSTATAGTTTCATCSTSLSRLLGLVAHAAGAIGMTYETDGGGNLALRRDDETVVTLLDGIERHFTRRSRPAPRHGAPRGAPARLPRVRAHRDRRGGGAAGARPTRSSRGTIAARRRRWRGPAQCRRRGAMEAGAFKANGARAVWAIRRAADEGEGAEGQGGAGGAPGAEARARTAAPHAFEHGAFVVDLAQPAARVARAFLERDPPIDSAFARGQLEKYERNLERGKNAPMEGYDFYDVTAWSLPVSYGVDAFELARRSRRRHAARATRSQRGRSAAERLADSLAIGVPQTARVARAGPLVMLDRKGGVALDLSGRIDGGRAPPRMSGPETRTARRGWRCCSSRRASGSPSVRGRCARPAATSRAARSWRGSSATPSPCIAGSRRWRRARACA